jgi:alpha-galactosidase
MLIGNLHAEMPAIEERLATAMGSGPLFLGDLRKLTPAELDWYGEKIRWFKKLRHDVRVTESFFPLGNWQQPGGAAWDGFARLSRQGEGLIVLFKNDSSASSAEAKLAVMPAGSYELRLLRTGKSLGKFAAEQLQRGVTIPFPAKHKAEIIEIRSSR